MFSPQHPFVQRLIATSNSQYLRQLSGFELNGYVMNTEGCNPQKPYESSFELNEYVMNTTH